MRLAALLYPRAWREQYGEEFQALLDDVRPGWREWLNVVGGALRMRVLHASAYWKLAAACGAAGMLVAAGLSWRADRRYVSTAALRMESPAGGAPSLDDTEQLADLARSIFSQTNLMSIITSPPLNLYAEERRDGVAIDVLARRMAGDIHVWRLAQGGLAVSFAYGDKKKAHDVVKLLTTELVEQNSRRNRMRMALWKQYLPQAPPPVLGTTQVVEAATLPEHPEGLHSLPYVGCGLAAGLALGLLTAATMRRPRAVLRMAGFAAAGAVLGWGASFLAPRTYTSTASLRITRPLVPMQTADRASVVEEFHGLERVVLNEESLTAIGRSLRIHLRPRDVRVRLLDPPVGFSISSSGRDGVVARKVVNQVARQFQERHAREERARAAGDPELAVLADRQLGVRYEFLDLATFPATPDFDWRLPMAAVGLTLGLLGAVWRRKPGYCQVNRLESR
jgi:hypothetical protein